MKKRGFTLAEVLITLGIIGVVAAMTIPTLIANYQKKQALSKIKQSYSLLAQAVKLSEAFNGDTNYWNYNQTNYNLFEQYITPYLKKSKKLTKDDADIKYYKPDGTEELYFTALYDNAEIIRLANGTDIFLPNTPDIRGGMFCFDINGYNQKPNTFGKDFFVVTIKKGYGLLPYGLHESSDYDIYDDYDRDIITEGTRYGCNTTGGNGAFCMALLIYDGWEFKEDYPY